MARALSQAVGHKGGQRLHQGWLCLLILHNQGLTVMSLCSKYAPRAQWQQCRSTCAQSGPRSPRNLANGRLEPQIKELGLACTTFLAKGRIRAGCTACSWTSGSDKAVLVQQVGFQGLVAAVQVTGPQSRRASEPRL